MDACKYGHVDGAMHVSCPDCRIEELEESLTAAQEELADARVALALAQKDADRYLWLKLKFSAVGSPAIYWNCEDFEPSEDTALVGDSLDEAIDAAISGRDGSKA